MGILFYVSQSVLSTLAFFFFPPKTEQIRLPLRPAQFGQFHMADETVVDVHLLDGFLSLLLPVMYHDLVDKLPENVWGQLLDVGVLLCPDDNQAAARRNLKRETMNATLSKPLGSAADFGTEQ